MITRSARQEGVDDLGDAVVGEAAVEVLDEVGGGEVADPESLGDGGVAEGEEEVALAGAGGADEAEVLRGSDPFEAGQVVEGRLGDRRQPEVELVQGLGDGEPCSAQAHAGVGVVSGGDLGVDEDPEDLFGLPTLRPCGLQDLRGDRPHRGELQPLERGDQISIEG